MWLTRPRDSGATRFAARLPLPYTLSTLGQ